jgi:predicted dehydrogenase
MLGRAYSSAAGAPKARIALAGAGWWSQGWHLPHLHNHPDAEIAAIIDPTFETAHWQGQGKDNHWSGSNFDNMDELGEKYSCPTFRDVDEMLESGVQVDGILVASNHATHAEIGAKVAAAGLHCLMEKPMTTDVPEAKALLAAADAGGKSFMVNNTANWRKNSQTAYEWVHAGEIGEVRHVNCYMGSPLASLFENPDAGGWVAPTGAAGINGFGWGQLSHTLAWVLQVTGLEPETVYASMILSEHSGADIYDAGTITCTNGALISVTGVATVPVEAAVPGDVTTATKQIDNKIIGTEGMILYSGSDLLPDSGSLTLRRHDGKVLVEPGFEFENYAQDANDSTGPESVHAFVNACLDRPYHTPIPLYPPRLYQ